MSINLNESGEQSSGGGAPIPPNSKVLVKLCIQYPKPGREGRTYPLTQSASSSLEYLGTQLEICCGSFVGKTIYHNFNLSGASSDNQRKAVDISLRSMRALVEAARNISPKDASPQATQARLLNAWTDVEGMIFPIVVDCEISKPNSDGKKFVNNVMKRVVTLDDAEFQQLRNGGQIITDEPLPQIPVSGGATGAGANAATGKASAPVPPWAGAGQPSASGHGAAQYAPPSSGNTAPAAPPAWAQNPSAPAQGASPQQHASPAGAPPAPPSPPTQAAPPPTQAAPPPFPSEASNIDQLPF